MSIDAVAHALRAVLAQSGRAVMVRDRATGTERAASLDTAVAADGLLPIFLAAGEAVWKDATDGRGFGLRVAEDADAVLGYRVTALGTAPLPIILLSTMEAIEQVAGPAVVPVNALNDLCREAAARAAPARPVHAPVQGMGAAP